MTHHIVVGLDIGTTKIACFVGRRNEFGKIEILSMGHSESNGVMRGVVINIEQTIESIKKAVAQAQERVEGALVIETINVGIAGQHIKSLQHHGVLTRRMTDSEISQVDIDELIDDMYRLVMEPGEEIIHVLPQEYIVDGEQGIKNPIGMAGVRMEANFHIITGKISAAKNITKCVERSDLIVDEMILEPLASSEAVLSEEEKDAGVVLVDIGGGTTDVAIFYDGIIRHTAVIPFGGNVITDDIREGCSIMRKPAELLKQQFGSALASESQENEIVCIPGLRGREPKEISIRNLASIIQARMEEIVEQVYFEIKNSGYERKLQGGIVVTGGGSLLKHIPQLFEYITGLDTRVGYPNEHLANSSVIDTLSSPIYATGIGLVIKGFQKLDRKGLTEAELNNKKKNKVKGHSEKTKGSFFEKIISQTRDWFEETDE